MIPDTGAIKTYSSPPKLYEAGSLARVQRKWSGSGKKVVV
jgi:hypothetical protein